MLCRCVLAVARSCRVVHCKCNCCSDACCFKPTSKLIQQPMQHHLVPCVLVLLPLEHTAFFLCTISPTCIGLPFSPTSAVVSMQCVGWVTGRSQPHVAHHQLWCNWLIGLSHPWAHFPPTSPHHHHTHPQPLPPPPSLGALLRLTQMLNVRRPAPRYDCVVACARGDA